MASASSAQLAARYDRIHGQLVELFAKNDDPIARMATISALLHHKMPHFFWTGFYILRGGKLYVGPYQGPLACAVLDEPEGVCWACVKQEEAIIVPDVHAFAGHVACDARSQSEIVLPVLGSGGALEAVLDVDSDQPDSFSDVDRAGLEKIVALISATGP
jgi:L-methionine (R)-S-oxide reductase